MSINTDEKNLRAIDYIRDNIAQMLEEKKINGGYGIKDTNLKTFLTELSLTFGISYSDFSPFISGNYAVFMEHGTWFNALLEYQTGTKAPLQIENYISSAQLNHQYNFIQVDKWRGNLALSQSILDIQVPEPNKEYMAISTRQKNSFVNTRDFVGSDFSMNFLETANLDIIKYMESWHKSIDLIREGLFFSGFGRTNEEYFESILKEDYLIPNPYCNTIWVALFDSKGIELRGIIALFGVMPMNLPLKTLLGERNSPKLTMYNLNFKFMDLQYKFVEDWSSILTANNENDLGKKFFNFLGYGQNNQN